MAEITVFLARTVRTMEPSLLVAVRDGRIVEVGTLETLRPWLDSRSHEIDDTFRDHCIMPGFIDPHLHPSMAAMLLPMQFMMATGVGSPLGDIPPVGDGERFLARLVDIDAGLPPGEPLFAFGHHPIWHGGIDRRALNEISTARPIVVWHRGYHSLVVNDACLRWMDLDTAAASSHPQIDLKAGKFFETGLEVALHHLRSFILEVGRFRGGLDRMRQVIHRGGHTTIGDAAFGFYVSSLGSRYSPNTSIIVLPSRASPR